MPGTWFTNHWYDKKHQRAGGRLHRRSWTPEQIADAFAALQSFHPGYAVVLRDHAGTVLLETTKGKKLSTV